MAMPRTASSGIAAYSGYVDAAGGLATVVLAVIGLTGTTPTMLAAIATIVFSITVIVYGTGLMFEGVAGSSEYGRGPEALSGGSGGLSAVLLSGIAGIILGILAFLGIVPSILIASAITAFGAALLLSSGAVWQLHQVHQRAAGPEQSPNTGFEVLVNEVALGSAGLQALAGTAGIVLGILALSGNYPITLSLAGFLVLGGTLILTGGAVSSAMLMFVRRPPAGRSYPTTMAE